MATDGAMVNVDNVHKVFHTRHVLQRDEESGKRFFYRKKTVHATHGVTFDIQRGEIFGLLGPNGAGKTTTMKMISGLVRPTAGSVHVAGLHVEQKRLKALREVGVVLEGTRTSIWPLTPLENLQYFGNLKDVRGSILKTRARELLHFIGLQDKMNVQVRHLSRGQKQKLAICIALISDPPVILLDEPTTGLDVQSSRSIKDKIVEMTREHGKSVLVTTHDMHVAQELCDRIGIISDGKLVACKPTAALIDLFSESRFLFRVSGASSFAGLTGIPGVMDATETADGGDTILTVTTSSDAGERSEALFGVTESLRAQGALLLGIHQEKQNLENVFLRITGGDSLPAEKAGSAS